MGLLVTRNPSMSLPSLWISRSKWGDRTQSTLRLALTFLKPLHELNKAPHGTVPRFGSMSTSAVWCVPAKESNKNKSPNYRFPAYHQCTTYHQFCRFLLFENKMPSVPWKMRSLWSLCSILACREGVSFDKRVRVMNSSRDCLHGIEQNICQNTSSDYVSSRVHSVAFILADNRFFRQIQESEDTCVMSDMGAWVTLSAQP